MKDECRYSLACNSSFIILHLIILLYPSPSPCRAIETRRAAGVHLISHWSLEDDLHTVS